MLQFDLFIYSVNESSELAQLSTGSDIPNVESLVVQHSSKIEQ